MKSPFPGMDPYIEDSGLWEGFHNVLIVNIADALASILPEGYFIEAPDRSYIVMVDGKEVHTFLPDIGIAKTRQRKRKADREGSTVAVLPEPVALSTMIALVDEEHCESFIEIREDSPGRRLVTSIELLSPTNKRPGTVGWDLYQRKRQSCLLGNVNLVEMDLVRAGDQMPMADPWPECTYTYLLARSKNALKCTVWPIQLNQPLPPLHVPLGKADADLHLELQPLVDSIYDRYRYYLRIDYRKALSLPLSKKDSAWAASCVRAARKK